MLRRQRAIEVVPGGKPLRWRRYDVPQHLTPETSDSFRFCAVEGDLDLLDRRHRSTIGAGSFVVSTGPPLARLWRMRPALKMSGTLPGPSTRPVLNLLPAQPPCAGHGWLPERNWLCPSRARRSLEEARRPISPASTASAS